MSWIRCSKIVVAAVLIAVALSAVGVVAAVTFDDSGVPEAVEVGEDVTVNVTTDDPFDGKESTWTIEGTSDLDDADVTIIAETVGGDTMTGDGEDGLEISADDGVNHVTVEVSGTVPDIEEYDYENPDTENIMLLEVGDADGPVIDTWHVHRYTQDSQEARQAIDDARDVVDDANDDDASDRLDEAIVHYNNAEFDRATSAAQDAEDEAESGGELVEILMILAGVLLILGIAGGGFYYWRQQQQNTTKLQ